MTKYSVLDKLKKTIECLLYIHIFFNVKYYLAITILLSLQRYFTG